MVILDITGWQMVDVSDPVAPVVRAIYHLNGAAAHAAKSGDKYWVVDGDGGLNILQEDSNQITLELTLINPGWSKTADFTVLVLVISGSYALEHRASVEVNFQHNDCRCEEGQRFVGHHEAHRLLSDDTELVGVALHCAKSLSCRDGRHGSAAA